MILSAGLSPAWQQILRFDTFQTGEVNRATEAVWCASGKVVNVAVAATSLGAKASMISAIGGVSGDIIQRELELLNVHAEWIHTSEATRVCTTILDASGETTELVENMSDVDEAVLADFADRTKIYANVADITVFTGSLPSNAPTDIFAQIMRETPARFLLDLRGEPLQKCLPFSPFLIKPNRKELESTLGRSLDSDNDLIQAMRSLNDGGVGWVLVSDGPRGVWLTSEEIAVRMHPPEITVVNPIGCGDSLTAGIAHELVQHDDVLAAVRFGMGAAAENAGKLLPARLNPERCKALAEQVRIEVLDD